MLARTPPQPSPERRSSRTRGPVLTSTAWAWIIGTAMSAVGIFAAWALIGSR